MLRKHVQAKCFVCRWRQHGFSNITYNISNLPTLSCKFIAVRLTSGLIPRDHGPERPRLATHGAQSRLKWDSRPKWCCEVSSGGVMWSAPDGNTATGSNGARKAARCCVFLHGSYQLKGIRERIEEFSRGMQFKKLDWFYRRDNIKYLLAIVTWKYHCNGWYVHYYIYTYVKISI